MEITLIAKNSLRSLFRRRKKECFKATPVKVAALEPSRTAVEAEAARDIITAETVPCPGAGVFCAFCDFCMFAIQSGE
jgi:hypothetical protein